MITKSSFNCLDILVLQKNNLILYILTKISAISWFFYRDFYWKFNSGYFLVNYCNILEIDILVSQYPFEFHPLGSAGTNSK